ncbi:MAG: type I pullulanase [Fimbriimonadaceae bacterium]|nr:type I pullulanase [Fimbriimonadaceae bacterium]QYK58643.1 MAG: type I pullulanase [Fimbriimonadaceae bacterium]
MTLLSTLIVLAAGSVDRANPAFLDAPDLVNAWFDEAVDVAEMTNVFELVVAGRTIQVSHVSDAGQDSVQRDPDKVTLPGTIQAALGGQEWSPNDDSTKMRRTAPGVYELVVAVPGGRYEYKVAQGGTWEKNWGAGLQPGGQNIVLVIPLDGTLVRFVVDFNSGFVKDSINHPEEVTAPTELPPIAPEPVPSRFHGLRLRLAEPVTDRDVSSRMVLRRRGHSERPVFVRDFLSRDVFHYSKTDLGASWSRDHTTFKVWSPVASGAEVWLYSGDHGGTPRRVPMARGTAGVWYAKVPGNLDGRYYQYRFDSPWGSREAADIYGVAASPDLQRTMVLNRRRTDPEGWPSRAPGPPPRPTDSVIYEIHVRDFTVSPASGVKEPWRGKYLGLVQTGTRAPISGQATGLDYLKWLGVTHVHLLPIQNFNPAHSRQYNWGYETTLFNMPEEQYSTRPADPVTWIRETKQMVAGFHKAGIRVVLDVVYNHTVPSEGPLSAFWQTVPYYYFRTNLRGDVLNESGVGNALADERTMVRKYVRDSLLFWTREYGIDGFRFDLLGMHDPRSVRDWSQAVRRIRSDTLLYGEPWTGGGPTRSGKAQQAGSGMAVFNDHFRGTMRGDLDSSQPGFAMGGPTDLLALKRAVVGSIDFSSEVRDFADHPSGTINYVSAHDNLTLLDKTSLALPGAQDAEIKQSLRFALATVLLSQGIPFLEGGSELGRTKGGNHNSYNAGDSVNQFDWERAARYQDVANYVRDLIAVRWSLPALRLATTDEVRKRMKFIETGSGSTVGFRVDGRGLGGRWADTIVVFQGSRQGGRLLLPEGQWNVLATGGQANPQGLGKVQGQVELAPLSASVFAR